jgi:hypothetical protein
MSSLLRENISKQLALWRGLSKPTLAKVAGLHVNSVRRLERSKTRCGSWAGRRIKEALEFYGVEVLDNPTAVRLSLSDNL